MIMKKNSFRYYLRRSLLLYTFALILLFFLLYMGFMTANLRMSTMRVNAQANAELNAEVTAWQRELEKTVAALADAPEVLAALEDGAEPAVTRANRTLYGRVNALPVPCVFALLDEDGEIVSTNLYRDNRPVFLKSAARRAMGEMLDQKPDGVYEGYSRIDYAYDQSTDWLFAARARSGGQTLGTLLVDVTDAGLRAALRGRQADMVVLADRFDNVFYADNPAAVGVIGKLAVPISESGFVTLDQREYFVSVSTVARDGVRVLTFSSTVLHKQMLSFGMLLITLLSAALLLLAPLLANRMTLHDLRPVEKMIETVRKQDLNGHIGERTFDEFQPLYDEFNAMMNRVRTLIRHNEELSERKRVMEVRHLKEQFNPHFVFNVMENLHFVLLSDPKKAADMLVAFGSLMRYEIDDAQTLSPLETDMEYVSDYLLLQKMRYGKRLCYRMDVPQELSGCRIPKLLVQPIVENSLKHGMPDDGVLTVRIAARRDGAYLIVTIADDGAGMPPEQLRQLQDTLAQEDAPATHIGLYNTHRALLLMYGAPCGLQIQSEANAGTVVQLTVAGEWDNA